MANGNRAATGVAATTVGRQPHYRPEIDGLRAIAIVPVVLFHAAVPGFASGFIGVDVFFVISGYLITGILVRDLAAGRIRYGHFYERRVRRIVPALLVVLAFSAALAWLVMTGEDFRHFGRSLGATALFGSNVWYALRSNYFLPEASVRPLLHTWSLGVEEQFYLVFPFALGLAWAVGRRAALVAVAGLLSASMAAAFWLAGKQPQMAFFLLPTRLWELMAGAACALLPQPGRRSEWGGWLGLALLIAGFALIDDQTPVPGPMMVIPVAGTALILLCGQGVRRWSRVLAAPPLVALGLISYGTYLWHLPLFALSNYVWFGPLPAAAVGALVTASLVLGWLSFWFLERPVRRRRMLASRRALGVVSLGGLALFAALGTAIATGHLGPSSATVERAMGGTFAGDGFDEVIIPPGSAELDFVLYGDSHARQYFKPFSERLGTGALISGDGCLSLPQVANVSPDDPDTDHCRELFGRLDNLLRTRPAKLLVIAHLWDREVWDRAGTPDGSLTSGAGRSAFESALARAIDKVPEGTRVVLIGHVPAARPPGFPAMDYGWPRCERYLNTTCPTRFARSQAEGTAINRVLSAFAARHPRVIFFDPADILCGPQSCPIVDRGQLVYNDESHVSLRYGRLITAQVMELLNDSARR